MTLTGIQQLRNRPGLALEATVAHGSAPKLDATTALGVKTSGLHLITGRYNMRNATEADLAMVMAN